MRICERGIVGVVVLVLLTACTPVRQTVSPADDPLIDLKVKAAEGDAEAQLLLGAMYGEGNGFAPNHQEAAKWYRLAAEQGHAEAQNMLGWMYANGNGVPQDYSRAASPDYS